MRILIATVTAGGGHLAAAAALDEAWRALRPRDVVERVDLVKFFSPLHRKIHADGYVKLVERAPELWGMIFAKTDHPKVARRLNRVQQLFPSRSRSRYARLCAGRSRGAQGQKPGTARACCGSGIGAALR